MTYIPLTSLPGVCKVNSAYANSNEAAYTNGRAAIGRFTDMNNARFIAGYPEKIGGWNQLYSSALTGVPRGLKDWRDNSQVIYLGIGTNAKLYVLSQQILTDITPLRAILTGSLTNPFTTTNGSAVVSVAHTAHGLQNGDYVSLTAGSSVGGLTIAGIYHVSSVTTNAYNITLSSNATSSVSGGGGTTAYIYYRITLTNPFATTAGSSTVTVTHSNHGAAVGDYVTINGASAVGGVTPSGEYQITGVTTNTYNITVSSAASSTTTGGGTPNLLYDISTGNIDSAYSFGFGTGTYSGSQGYSQVSTSGILLNARSWSLARYGQQLIANPYGGSIYIWDPTVGGRAYPLYNAPPAVNAMFVTPERFVFAIGTSLPMQIQWPDQTDYTQWTPTINNTANARTLQQGSYLIGGIAVRDGVSMVFSNTAAYTFTYSGDNFIYNSAVAGDGSGLLGPLAVTTVGGIAYWIGPTEFWTWNGAVQPLPSDDIRDYVFTNINIAQIAKCVAAPNIAKKEVWFFYCSGSSTEIDSYVIYHIDQQCWSVGKMQRTSWIDRGLFPNPVTTDATGLVFNQESGLDANGVALDAYVTFSPMDIAKGDRSMDIFTFIPDFARQSGNVSLSVLTQTYPQDTQVVSGPYTIASDDSTPRIDLRINGKLIGYKLESNTLGGDFRLGVPRVEAQQGGARR